MKTKRKNYKSKKSKNKTKNITKNHFMIFINK